MCMGLNKTKYFVLRQFDEVCSENYEVNEERLLKEAAPSAANNIQATSL